VGRKGCDKGETAVRTADKVTEQTELATRHWELSCLVSTAVTTLLSFPQHITHWPLCTKWHLSVLQALTPVIVQGNLSFPEGRSLDTAGDGMWRTASRDLLWGHCVHGPHRFTQVDRRVSISFGYALGVCISGF
jgi:hypothetical protein